MCCTTKNNESTKLNKNPSVRKHCRFLYEVDELQRDREVCKCDKEIRDILILHQQLICRPLWLNAITVLHGNHTSLAYDLPVYLVHENKHTFIAIYTPSQRNIFVWNYVKFSNLYKAKEKQRRTHTLIWVPSCRVSTSVLVRKKKFPMKLPTPTHPKEHKKQKIHRTGKFYLFFSTQMFIFKINQQDPFYICIHLCRRNSRFLFIRLRIQQFHFHYRHQIHHEDETYFHQKPIPHQENLNIG